MDFIHQIYQSGVVGAGGAGFPTHIKYNTKVDTLLINAAECEPLLFTDQYEMENFASDIIKGISIGREILGANTVKIAIKEKHKASIKALEKAIAGQSENIEIVQMESYYPAGDEHSIVHECMNTELEPGALPSSVGAVVSNVTTIRNVFLASQGLAVTHKKITVTGEVKNPVIIDVPVGTSIADCIAMAGGSDLEEYSILLGGPMMGKMIADVDAITTYVTKTTGGIILLANDHPLILRRIQTIEHIQSQTSSACIQCNFCTELCPRYLKGHPLHPHEVMKAFGFGDMHNPKLEQAILCSECGICELYSCPMGLSPRIVNTEVKKRLRELGKKPSSTVGTGVHPMDEYRRLPTDVLVQKISLTKYYEFHDLPFKKYEPKKVHVLLNQHIGKPAQAVVAEGDIVSLGQEIGHVEFEEMGACVHSSMQGKVTKVTEEYIEISQEEVGI